MCDQTMFIRMYSNEYTKKNKNNAGTSTPQTIKTMREQIKCTIKYMYL